MSFFADWLEDKENRFSVFLFFILFFSFFGIGHLILVRDISSDLQLHAGYCRMMNKGEFPYTGIFLMFFIVNIISGFSTDFITLYYVLACLVSTGFASKGVLIFRLINSLAGIMKSFWFSLGSMIYFGIPVLFFVRNRYFYVSNQTPNVFHSSSAILVAPLTLILFFLQISYWRGKKVLGWICLVIFLTASIKPSFLLVYLAVTPFFSIWRFGFNREFFSSLIPCIFLVFILVIQAVLIYFIQYGVLETDNSHIIVSFFDYWSFFYPEKYFLYSCIGGFFFPICFWLVTIDQSKSISFYYSGFLVFVSLLIFIFFSETGARRFHGNFGWQTIFAHNALLVVCLREMFRLEVKGLLPNRKKTMLYSIFSIHVLCGLIYLYRFLVLKDYN